MITKITISGFRGIARELSFQLGAITLLSGRNGLGKTTVFDAIDWCLFGSSWRLGLDSESIRNIYHPSLDPVVRLEMQLTNKKLLIERRVSSAFLDGSKISDRELVHSLMVDPDSIAPYARDVESSLRRLVYLSQEDVRILVHPETMSERKSIFQALLGVPNASAMYSGVRRITEHFLQREEELRLHLAQLHTKGEELDTTLESSKSDGVDTSRVISEAMRAMHASEPVPIEQLMQRCRQELDALSSESIRLDEDLAAIEAFRERRKIDSEGAEQLNSEIQLAMAEHAAAVSANEDATQRLLSAQRNSEEQGRVLAAASLAHRRLQDRSTAQRSVIELKNQERTASKTLKTYEETAETLRNAIDDLRRASDLALERRRALSTKRSEVEVARDRLNALRDRQRHESELINRQASLSQSIIARTRELESLRVRLRQAQQELDLRREDHSRSTRAVSSIEVLESLLREAISLLPPEQSECPLCGTNFSSPQELLLHTTRSQEKFRLSSDALDQSLAAFRNQQETVDQLEQELQDATSALQSLQLEEERVNESITSVRDFISMFSQNSPEPTGDELETLNTDLTSTEAEIRRLANDIDNTTIQYQLVQADVSRASLGLKTIQEGLAQALAKAGPEPYPADIDKKVAEAAMAVRSATDARQDAADAARSATDDQQAKRVVLDSIERRIGDLQSRLVGLRQKQASETETLVRQLGADDQETFSINVAAEGVLNRRAEVADRIALLKRLWSELFTVSVEERSKAIRLQIDAVNRELKSTQRSLNQVLRAKDRFEHIAKELQQTAEIEASGALQNQYQAIQECFAAVYPHAHLNEIVFDADGQIQVTDKRIAHAVEPNTYLSTGQANVLGLSIFMGIALRQRILRIGLMCLDEPVQHLDDLHFLGFVSLLKRVALSRQVLFSTADANVAEIISRQMQSSWAESSTDFVRYDWYSFDPEIGPGIVRVSAQRAAA